MKRKIKKTTVRKNEQLFEKMDVLTHFFENHEREFHLREIARLIGLAPSTVSKYLNSFVNEKILITRTFNRVHLKNKEEEINGILSEYGLKAIKITSPEQI